MGSRWMMAIISLFIIFLGYGIGYASEEPEIYGQFEKVGPIILDTVTGLEWQVGPDQLTDWYEAEKWVDGLEGTWRMPSIAELQRLWDSGITCIAWGPFENSGMWIWSSQVRPPPHMPVLSTSSTELRPGPTASIPTSLVPLRCVSLLKPSDSLFL